MPEEKTLLDATLCFLVKKNRVLLAVKSDKIGKGCLNGYGGGIEPGQTPIQGIIAELAEEAKVQVLPEDLEKMAIINFHNTKTDGTTFTCKVHVYLASRWKGKPQETEEMLAPKWFKKTALPLDMMMPADRLWVPMVLAGKKITANFTYGPFQETLLPGGTITPVDSLPGD